MSDEINNLITNISRKHLDKNNSVKKNFNIFRHFNNKKIIHIILITLPIAIMILWIFSMDYFTKRQAYPIRKVLFQCQETVYFSGGDSLQNSDEADNEAVSIISKGNKDGTKIGDILGVFKREVSDEIVHYQIESANKTRVAYAAKKSEKFQAGLRLSGTMNFCEHYSELIDKPGKYITYSFIPERGEENIDLNVLIDESGKRKLVNELITYRSIPLGVYYGVNYRNKTVMNEFQETEKNKKLFIEIIKTIDVFNSPNLSRKEREKACNNLLDMIKALDKNIVFISYEDGLFDILPQESTTFLFCVPNLADRIKYSFLPSPSKIMRFRIENQWDLWPGNYPELNRITIGTPPDIIRPFAHVNNGGYTIKDNLGIVAKITIRDFILHYGDDLIYSYYLDKNGDGKIDKTHELIGEVLYRISRDENFDLENQIGLGKEKKDITQRKIYSFMAGSDWESRDEDFYLCNTMESFMINELNRGFGKHSSIGWIHSERSNILLLENQTLDNLSRAITTENSLVAVKDINALLKAAKRNLKK